MWAGSSIVRRAGPRDRPLGLAAEAGGELGYPVGPVLMAHPAGAL